MNYLKTEEPERFLQVIDRERAIQVEEARSGDAFAFARLSFVNALRYLAIVVDKGEVPDRATLDLLYSPLHPVTKHFNKAMKNELTR